MDYYSFDVQSTFPAKKNDAEGDISFADSIAYFTRDDAKIVPSETEMTLQKAKDEKDIAEANSKRKKKSTSAESPAPNIIPNTSYSDSYNETTGMLKQAILQADVLTSEIKQDIDTIRNSKTMKGKYTYITNLTSAEAGLISTKISAIREINNTITQAHNLEQKRAKDMKEDARNQQSDDARMMDMYNAFINSPMGMYDNRLNMPKIPDMLLTNPNVQGVPMAGPNQSGNLTPEQLRMRMEGNPNIEEVVMYEPSSGRRWFEVVDNSTGMPVQNYPKTDDFFLSDMTIDVRAGTARNRNLDKVWRLVNIEAGTVINEY